MRKIKESEKKFIASCSKSYTVRPEIKKLTSVVNDWEDFWNRPKLIFFKKVGLKTKDYDDFLKLQKMIDPEKEEELLEKEGIRIISISDKNYPKLLKEISSPPVILFVRGELQSKENTLAIVGARKSTSYGMDVTLSLAEKVAQAGMVVEIGRAHV